MKRYQRQGFESRSRRSLQPGRHRHSFELLRLVRRQRPDVSTRVNQTKPSFRVWKFIARTPGVQFSIQASFFRLFLPVKSHPTKISTIFSSRFFGTKMSRHEGVSCDSCLKVTDSNPVPHVPSPSIFKPCQSRRMGSWPDWGCWQRLGQFLSNLSTQALGPHNGPVKQR